MTSLQRISLSVLLLLAGAGVPACADDEGPGGSAPAADAAPAAPDGAPGAGLPFLAPCTQNDECASGLCFNFNAKGLHCTHACQSAADCEAPSPGCSGMNVCKAP
jgi:hypothetical protein